MPILHIAMAVFIQILWGPIYTLAKPAVGKLIPPVNQHSIKNINQ